MRAYDQPKRLTQRPDPTPTSPLSKAPRDGEKLADLYQGFCDRQDQLMDSIASKWPPGRDPNRRKP